MGTLLNIESKEGVTVINLTFNEISLDQGEELKKLFEDIAARDERSFVVNLSGIGFLSSLVIVGIMHFNRKVTQGQGKIKLSGLSRDSFDIMRITQLDKIFEFYDTTRDAVESFKRI